jgi:hypothetical protein
MVAVPVEEFSLADENGNNLACVNQTPSEQLLYKDDEAGTPSQPCPPSYQVVGKGQAIKVDKTWFTEDANRNGSVCLKTWDMTNDFIVHDDNTSTPSQPCAPALAVLVYGQAAEPADPAEPAPAELAK